MPFKARTVIIAVLAGMLLGSMLTYSYTTSMIIGQGTGGAAAGDAGNPGNRPGNAEIGRDQLWKIEQTYKLIKSESIQKIDDEKLMDGAVNGMLEALKDPYTVYMDKNTASQFKDSIESSFQGIGAVVSMQNGKVTVETPIKNSPAEAAGIKAQDQIISVNGEDLEGLPLSDAVMKIRGPKGSKANLKIIRPGIPDPLEIVVVRDEIPLETVYAEMLEGQIGYLNITQFSMNTAERFKTELQALESQGIKGLVIDVRDNPGGVLEVVIEMAEQLVPKGKIILKVESKGEESSTVVSDGKAKSYPVVILVNKGSASASEILAAAAQQSAGIKLVGETTFGKGTVQRTEDLRDGSNIKLTIAKWLTPNGTWINEKGIKPDIEVKQPDYFQTVPIDKSKIYMRDMNSSDVMNIQLMLKGIGYVPGRTDGYFDEETELAVKAFQKVQSLPLTGQVDETTAVKLEETLIAKIKDRKNDLQLQTGIQWIRKTLVE